MFNKKVKEKRHNDADDAYHDHEKERIFCPVCGKLLHEDNLVDVKSVVEDNLYYVGGVSIVDCTVHLHCYFEHQFEETETTMDEPHKLMAAVDAEFDRSGVCVQFEIVEVLPAE